MYFLVFLFSSFSLFSSPNSDSLVKYIAEKYGRYNSISYDIEYMIKTFDDQQPFYVQSRVIMERIPADTVFYASFIYKREDSLVQQTKYYDGEKLFVFDHTEKKCIRFDPQKGETYPVSSSQDGNVIKTYFHDIHRLTAKLNRKNVEKQYRDSSVYTILTLKYPDFEEYTGSTEQIYFNTLTHTIDKITFEVYYKDQIQRNQWLIKNVVFDQVQSGDFEKMTGLLFDTYSLSDFERPSPDHYKLLENGQDAPPLQGSYFPHYEKKEILKPSKVLLLDFWYTRCAYCVKSIPYLNLLREKYGDQLLVIGVNPVEASPEDRERIELYLKRNAVSFPVFITDKVPEAYNITGYPTLYVINERGKVIFSKLGAGDEKFFHELDKALAHALKK